MGQRSNEFNIRSVIFRVKVTIALILYFLIHMYYILVDKMGSNQLLYAPIIGLPQDGGVRQPRGIRLRKAHELGF